MSFHSKNIAALEAILVVIQLTNRPISAVTQAQDEILDYFKVVWVDLGFGRRDTSSWLLAHKSPIAGWVAVKQTPRCILYKVYWRSVPGIHTCGREELQQDWTEAELAAQEPSMERILITECYFPLSSQICFYDSWQMPKKPMSVEDLFKRFPHMLSLGWDPLLRTLHLQEFSFKLVFLSFLHISGRKFSSPFSG